MLPSLSEFLQALPALQSFGISGTLVTLLALFLMFRGRKSKDEAEIDELEHDRTSDIYRENLELRRRLREVEENRDRGWDLARWWCRAAHDRQHALGNALFRWGRGDAPAMTAPLPGLEEPFGLDPQSIPARYLPPSKDP